MVTTHEPGATKIGMRLRALLLDTCAHRAVLAGRGAAVRGGPGRARRRSVIMPALARGAIVVTDRYVDSSLAYQGAGRDLPLDEIARINRWATGGLHPGPHHPAGHAAEAGLSRRARSGRPDRGRARRVPPAGPGRVPPASPDAEPAPLPGARRDRSPDEITREIQDRVRELLPDPVPDMAEADTGSFPAIRTRS